MYIFFSKNSSFFASATSIEKGRLTVFRRNPDIATFKMTKLKNRTRLFHEIKNI